MCGWACRRNVALSSTYGKLMKHSKRRFWALLFLPFLLVHFQSEDHEFAVSGLGGRRVGGEFVTWNVNETTTGVDCFAFFALTSQVLLVLTTFQVPPFMVHSAQSHLYRRWEIPETWRSAVHYTAKQAVVWGSNCCALTVSAKTMGRPSRMWLTWSTTPSSTQILASPSVLTTRERWGKGGVGRKHLCFDGISEDSFQSSTLCWIQVMLTGDVSETGGFRLFRSRDFGLTFDPIDLPFEPLIQMLYNPGDCNIILTLSVMVPAFQL